jgi:hypothetical protein
MLSIVFQRSLQLTNILLHIAMTLGIEIGKDTIDGLSKAKEINTWSKYKKENRHVVYNQRNSVNPIASIRAFRYF